MAQTELTMWYHGAGEPTEAAILEGIISDFNASQSDWVIALESFPQASYNDSKIAAAAAKIYLTLLMWMALLCPAGRGQDICSRYNYQMMPWTGSYLGLLVFIIIKFIQGLWDGRGNGYA